MWYNFVILFYTRHKPKIMKKPFLFYEKISPFFCRKYLVIALLSCFISGCNKSSLELIIPEKEIDITVPKLTYQDKRELSYGTNPYQKYDLFLPNLRNTRNPVIVLLHGGAWRVSDKSSLNFVVDILKNKRVNCAIINANYRLASPVFSVTYRQQVEDIGKLLRKITADSKDLGISSDFYLIGMSSGGHLALLYTATADQDHLVAGIGGIAAPIDLTNQKIREGIIGYDIQQLIGKTYVQAPDDYKDASPIYQGNSRKVPTILFYGDKDNIVTSDQSTMAKLAISSRLACNEHYFYADQSHEWSAWSESLDKMISFAERNL
jgi:acetyl esterase/lipase